MKEESSFRSSFSRELILPCDVCRRADSSLEIAAARAIYIYMNANRAVCTGVIKVVQQHRVRENQHRERNKGGCCVSPLNFSSRV